MNKGHRWLTQCGYEGAVINVFEDGAEGKGEFMGTMRKFGQQPPVFRTKKECPPFQIADLAAYELFKKCTDLDAGELRSRRSFDGLFSIPNTWEVWERAGLERYCVMNNVPPRDRSSAAP